MCASSLDGKIARDSKDPIDWTSKDDKNHFARETKKAGVILMGKNTFDAIGRPLPGRLNIVFTSKAKDLKSDVGKLEFADSSPESVLKDLEFRKFKNCFLIGGSKLNTYFLNQDLIDEIWLTIEGVILGNGIGLFGDTKFVDNLKLLSSSRLGEKSVLLKYRLKK